MSWANSYIEGLKKGETVKFRPVGNSMAGRVESGQLCTVKPFTDSLQVKAGDVVLCEVEGQQFLHLVKSINDGRYKIGNNRGKVNGVIDGSQIYGKLITVED